MLELPIFPLPATVVFPGMTVPLYVFEARYKELVRSALALEPARFVIALAREAEGLDDLGAPFYEVGTVVQVVDSSENPDGTFNLLGHGQERCRVKPGRVSDVAEPDGSKRPLYYTEFEDYPLERSDPNLERVAAWDALDAFRAYARTFFTEDALGQIEGIIPEDLVFQASFICANVRVETVERQKLLELTSLTKRFQEVEKLMRERIAAHKPAGPE